MLPKTVNQNMHVERLFKNVHLLNSLCLIKTSNNPLKFVHFSFRFEIQQGLNPAPIDPIQAKVMKMFPIVFTIFFLFFPSGLVLYWVINNTLSIIQQTYITRQIAKMP